MSGNEYLERVVDTIATHGNRGNDNFVTAFTLAQGFIDDGADLDYNDLLRVDRQLRQGLEFYCTGAKYYESATRYAYETLLMFFSGNEAMWKSGALR